MMTNQLNVIFQDPIILASGLVFIATVIILVWAVKTIQTLPSENIQEIDSYEDSAEPIQPYEASGIIEARLTEINSQLSTIVQTLGELQKSINEKKSFDDTVPNMGNVNIDKIAEKIEAKISEFSSSIGGTSSPPGKPEDLDRIETKLDSIRKLLILLTDSEHPSE